MKSISNAKQGLSKSRIVQRHIKCPSCPSSDAYCLYEDGHGHCFSCNYHRFSDGREDFILDEGFSYEYLPIRGITRETLEFYDAKTKIDRDGKPVSIGFKYPNGAYKVRLLDKKDFYTSGEIAKAGLFGRDKFSSGGARYVTITEGEFDALSLCQALSGNTGSSRVPVVSVQSSVTAGRDCIADRAWLNSFERIYIAFDGDEPGRQARAEVARLFDYNKIFVVPFTRRKDANEYVQHGEDDELKKIWWNSKQFLPDTIISSLDEFSKILREAPQRGVDYPFPTLTEMTYGIRRGESVLITAQEGIGKTEIMHAIEHKLLKETDSGIGAIFLEEPKRRHLQSLAGIELQRPVHLPDSGCTPDQVISALQSVVHVDDRLHVYSHFGSNDPDALLDTIRFLVSARACHYILLDHITMAVSGLAGEDERKALDYLSTRLEMMVKELNFALIIVSHVNDEGKTRGSRLISKIADIRIDAQRDIVNPDPRERSIVYLTISKSREIGKTGPAGRLYFDQEKRTYTEVPYEDAANDNTQIMVGREPDRRVA